MNVKERTGDGGIMFRAVRNSGVACLAKNIETKLGAPNRETIAANEGIKKIKTFAGGFR